MMSDHAPLLCYIFIKIGLIVQRYLKIINRVFQVDAQQAYIIANFSNRMIYIFQIEGFIAIRMGYSYSRLQQIARAGSEYKLNCNSSVLCSRPVSFGNGGIFIFI